MSIYLKAAIGIAVLGAVVFGGWFWLYIKIRRTGY